MERLKMLNDKYFFEEALGNEQTVECLNEVLSFYHALQGKKYLAVVADLMEENLPYLYDDTVIQMQQVEVELGPEYIVPWTDLISAKLARLPLDKKLPLYNGSELLTMQHSFLNEADILGNSLKKNIFLSSLWNHDDELICRANALKKALQIMATTFMDEVEEHQSITINDLLTVINNIREESKAMPVRNEEYEDSEANEEALDIITSIMIFDEDKYLENVSKIFYDKVK